MKSKPNPAHNSAYKIALQNIVRSKDIPSRYYFQRWVNTALSGRRKQAEIAIRIVDDTESAMLNQTYRKKRGPTNVLSFPFETPKGISLPILGDLVICAPLVRKEAHEQHKTLMAHWAHLVIHGTLHLLGYDHIKDDEADIMEAIEIDLLARLGYPNPYEH